MENTWNFIPSAKEITVSNPLTLLKEQLASLREKRDLSLDFKKVNIDSISIIEDFLERFPSHSCDFSIGGIVMWADYFNYEYAIFNDTLFLRGKDPATNRLVFYSPIGTLSEEEAFEIICNNYDEGEEAILISVKEEGYEDYLHEDSEERKDAFLDDWKEYVYPIEQFLDFPGKKMSKKRNHLNFFKNHYQDYEVEVIKSENISELIDFTLRFEENHEDSSIFHNESTETLEVLRNYEKFPFFGILIRYEGEIIGYSIAEKIGDICFVHIEKGNIEYQGVYQAVASNMAKYVHEHYPEVRFLNREEDMGFESLKRSKESYHPSIIENKRFDELPYILKKRLAI